MARGKKSTDSNQEKTMLRRMKTKSIVDLVIPKSQKMWQYSAMGDATNGFILSVLT